MKIKDAIAYADEMKPNAFSNAVKVRWLAELEGRLAANVFLLGLLEIANFSYTAERDMETELLVIPPHDDIYTLWLCAKIDEANGEYDKYQNTMQVYNAHFSDFLRWFGSCYDPEEGYISEEERNRHGNV